MEFMIALVGGLALLFPIIAVIALVRTSRLRSDLDEHYLDQQDKIRNLESQVSTLRRELSQIETPASRRTPSVPPGREAGPARATSAVPVTPQEPSKVQQSQPAPAPVSASPEHLAPKLAVAPLSQAPAASAPTAAVAAASGPAPRNRVNPLFSLAAPPAPPVRTGPTLRERLSSALPLEEVLGMNLFAKIGIVLLVLGFALLGRVALISMGPGERAALIFAVAAAMLGAGIWFERKERYRLIGRTGIGGGWALLFFTTYALHHVAAMTVIASNLLDCLLMFLVAAAMVGHTLRYRSQLVTGLAFLLAFSTVALSQDSVYSLAAGVILAIGIVTIALRMSWFELEVFGILATYANHFYWLYKLYPDGVAGHPFPQFWPSALILILYWSVFRISYVVRTIRTAFDESISTVAALASTILLLGVMKFQSTRPELAFYALLALGAAEFLFGQLPITRRRRNAFVLLSVLGTILIFAAVPFKFSGNNIALLWMIAAEVLLIAGFVQMEVVFRRLGWFGGALTGTLILYGARQIVDFRQHSDKPLIHSGVLLLACAVLFYLNALALRARWSAIFDFLDRPLATVHCYLGALTALLGIWAVFSADSTAVAWGALMLACAFGKRYLDDDHLLLQSGVFALAAFLRTLGQNCHFDTPHPHHVATRLVTLPLLALIFYVTAWALPKLEAPRNVIRILTLWGAASLLALLAWLDVSPMWISIAWLGLAIALCLAGRRLNIPALCHQEHVLALLAVFRLFAWNLYAPSAIQRYVPIIACAAALYAVSRLCTLRDASYRRPAAWAHTWVATMLLSALVLHECAEPWVAAIWAVFALALALADRLFAIEEFPQQAHLLALFAVARTVTLNLFTVQRWHRVDLRLLTVAIVIGSLYALARWVRLPPSLSNTETRHAYTWVASSLTAWLLWAELQPIAVAVAIAVFGLLLFELAEWKQIRQFRWQAWAALSAAFARIFFVNITAHKLPGELLSPRIYTIVPIALIYFYIWIRLQSKRKSESRIQNLIANLLACLGTSSIVALLYFEVQPERIVLAWALTVATLLSSSLFFRKVILLYQAEFLAVGIVIRGLAHNIFGGSYFIAGGWHGNLGVLSATSIVLLSCLPFAFRLRVRFGDAFVQSRLARMLALHRPEQILFFSPVLLVTFMIAVKMNPAMVTLAWAAEGFMMILLGLLAGQRSYRIAGLALLLLCVAKIVFRDAWHLGERDRYITFIVLGGALTIVSGLYGKYRETVRRLL